MCKLQKKLEQTEKQLGELGDKVDSAAKEKVEGMRLNLKEATDKEDYEMMKTLVEELQKELYSLGASVYQQAGVANDPTETTDNKGSNEGDDVIDAEFTETK